MSQSIPVINVSKIVSHDATESDFRDIGMNLSNAFSDVGFAYIIEHGVNERKVEDVQKASAKFFQRTVNEKRKFKQNSDTNQGYVEANQEIFSQKGLNKAIREIRESYDITSIEDEAVFPDTVVPELRTSVKTMLNDCVHLVRLILKSVFLSLGVDPDVFIRNYGDLLGKCDVPYTKNPNGFCKFRTIYYPPLTSNEIVNPGTIRCGEHSDYGILTLLFQDSMGGLEVVSSNGSWIPANPIPGSILINVGDLLEIYSNGKFRSTLHRVVIPEDEIRRCSPRQSLAFFIHPLPNTHVYPLNERENNYKYEPVISHQHLTKRINESYQY